MIRTAGANVCVYVSFSRGHGILSLVIVNCCESLFEYGATYVVCRIRFPEVKTGLKDFDRAKTGELFRLQRENNAGTDRRPAALQSGRLWVIAVF